MTYHVQTSIEGLLLLSNHQLTKLFDADGSNVRAQLKERYEKGERLIPSAGCDGFDPVTGCPGHEDEPENKN